MGLDMGVVNPLSRSDGQHITQHQGLEIAAHLARLERRKLRVRRQCSRKPHAAARKAGTVTDTGAFKKGVRIVTSNRMRRANERLNKIDRQIVGYRADWQRNKALEIARQCEIVVVEALMIQNLTRSAAGTAEQPGRNVRAKAALNRSILARGWGSMRARLKNKAEELCGRVIEIDPRHTSQQCPHCGHIDSCNRKTQAQASPQRSAYFLGPPTVDMLTHYG
jgi:transposase